MDPGSPGSGPGSSPHGPDVQRVESLTDTLPSPVIDHSHSAKLVASQLQPQPGALQSGLWLKAMHLLLTLKGLVCSFPWVQQVLQLQRSLLRSFGSATQDLLALLASIARGFTEAALTLHRSLRGAFPPGTTFPCGTSPREEDSTERTSFSRPPLREKLSRHSGVVAGAGSLLTMDPGSPGSGPGSSPHGPDVQRVESLTDTLPSPVIDHSHSAKLVASQLQPQPRALQSGLWLKALHLLLTLKGLVCAFPWVQQVLQLQRSLLKSFGSATQDLLALLASIARGFTEAALTLHRSLRGAFPPGTTFPCVVPGVGSLLGNIDPVSPGSGPGSSPHDTDEEWFESLTDTLSVPVIIHSVSLKFMLCQLLLQELLCSFPWVQVTEEKQEANTFRQSTAVYQVTQRVLDSLERTLGPRCVLREAWAFSSLLLQHHLLHLVALNTARLLPDEESTHQQRQVVAAPRPLPPPFSVSSELVEVLLVQLVLTLHPVDASGDQALSPRDLRELLDHLTAVIHRILANTPGVAVDSGSPLPLCNTRRPVLQLQSTLLREFESDTQELLARRDPALLASIANGVAEAVLTIYRSLRGAFPPGTTFPCVTSTREVDSIERTSSLTSVEDREEQEDDQRKAHNLCPLVEVPLVEGLHIFTKGKRKTVTWKDPLESTEPVAPYSQKKKRRKKKWYSRFRGLFCCCSGQSE
ncbi:unnamed protein product [Arctogadus glacialis]